MGIFDDIQSSAGGTPGIFDDIPNSSSMLRRGIADPAISLLKGAIAVPEAAVGLANIPTMGFAGKAAEGIGFRPKDARSELDTWYSPEQQASNRRVQDAKGFFPTVQAAVENPSVIGHSVAESIPSMLGGAAIARGLLGAGGGALSKAVGTTAAPTIAGAAGEGIIGAGLASEQIRQQTPTGTLTPEQIGYVGASGIGTALIGAAGGAAARKMGLSDIDTMLAGGIGTAGTRGMPARVLGGAVSEGALEEMPQSAQEQAWQNLALNKPVTEGVPEQAAMGLLSGAVMGGAGGIVPQRQVQPSGPLQKAAEAAQPGGVQPANTQPSGNPPGTIPGNQQQAAVISAAVQNTPAEPEIAPSPVPAAATYPTTNQAESAGVPISQPQEGSVSRGNEAQIAQPAEPGQQAQPAEAADSAAAEQEWRDFVASEGRDIGPRQLAVLRGQFMRRQRMASGIEEATGRVEAARQREIAANRMAILDALPLTTTGNTIRRYAAALRESGIRDSRVSPDERQMIARRVAARDTLQPLEQIPPNELTVPDKPAKPTTPTMPRIEALRRRASSPGVRIVGNRMLDRHGKRLATLTTDEVAQLTANVGAKADGKTPRQDRRPATDEELASFVQYESQDIGKRRATLRSLQAIRQQKQIEEADKAELDALIDSERENLRERFARLQDAQAAARAKKPFVVPPLMTPEQTTTGGRPIEQQATALPLGEFGRRKEMSAGNVSDTFPNSGIEKPKPESAPPVPDRIRNFIANTITKLRNIRDSLDNVVAARGHGHILVTELKNKQGDIDAAKARLAKVRAMAAKNGADVESVIAELGGEPDFTRFAAKQEGRSAARPDPLTQTFDQWRKNVLDANEYKGRYLRYANGDEDVASLLAVSGDIDPDNLERVSKNARLAYFREILDSPRNALLSLDVYDALNKQEQVEALRHFLGLEDRIDARSQNDAKDRFVKESEKLKPYEDALAAARAEIKRLGALPGPITAKQRALEGRAARLEQAVFAIRNGINPDGRLLKPAPSPEKSPDISPDISATEPPVAQEPKTRRTLPKKMAVQLDVARSIIGKIWQTAVYNKLKWPAIKARAVTQLVDVGASRPSVLSALDDAMTEFARNANGRLGYPNERTTLRALIGRGVVEQPETKPDIQPDTKTAEPVVSAGKFPASELTSNTGELPESPADAQHIDGKNVEAATPTVIKEAVSEGAQNAGLDLRKAHAILLQRIDSAIAAAPSEKDLGENAYVAFKINKDTTDSVPNTKPHLIAYKAMKAEQGANVGFLEKIDEAIADATQVSDAFVVFEVPGDGKFKITNTKERLELFRKKIASNAAGFRPVPKQQPYKSPLQKKPQTGSASDETIREMLQGGDLTAALELSKVVGRPLVFGTPSDPNAPPLVKTHSQPIAIEGFNLSVGRSVPFKKKGISQWSVTELESGTFIASGATKADAEKAAAEYMAPKTPEEVRGIILEMREAGKAKSQAELESRWMKWAEEEESRIDNADDIQEKADKERAAREKEATDAWERLTGQKAQQGFVPFSPASNPYSMDERVISSGYMLAVKNGKGDEFLKYAEGLLDVDNQWQKRVIDHIGVIRDLAVGHWSYDGLTGSRNMPRGKFEETTDDGRKITASLEVEGGLASGVVREDKVIKEQIGQNASITVKQARAQADKAIAELMKPTTKDLASANEPQSRVVTPDSLNLLRNPVGNGDTVRFADGSEWIAKTGWTGGPGAWTLLQGRKEHPTIKGIDGQAEFIRAIAEEEDRLRNAAPVTTPEQKQSEQYRYALVNRPASIGAVPNVQFTVEPRPPAGSPHHDLARHGIMVTDRKLTDQEVESFELAVIADEKMESRLVDDVAKQFGKYAEEWIEDQKDDPRGFVAAVVQSVGRITGNVRYSIGDIEQFSNAVLLRLNETKEGEDGNVILFSEDSRAKQISVSPADSAVYEMVSEGRSADEILSFISKASRRPFNRVLAAALRKAGLASKVTLDSAASFGKHQGAQRYAAAYNSRTDTVALFTPREAERHALHELVHAATMNAIKANGLSAVRLRALFRHVQKSGVADGQYGMSVNKDGTPNLDEFVAELFTKPEFQAFLKTVPAPAGSTLKSAWEWFVRIVARIVGIKTRAAETALDRALVLGAQLMQENVELRAADEARFGIADDVRFSVRNDPPPKKTITVYKLFRVKPGQPGKLFPLFVDANNPAEIGVWLDADVGPLTPIGKVKSSLGPLAFRPGWHGGDLPVATHIGEGGSPPRFRPANQVWAEVEMADDVDWQSEATRRAARTKAGGINAATAHITNQIPKDGSYRYKTNPNMAGEWVISGAMKINRILSDAEVEAINSRAGVADLPRQAPFDAKRYGFDSGIGFSQDQPFGGREIATTPLKPGATTIMVDGVDRPALNSNGKPIHWSEESVRNFWRWFGDSKVVDAQGRPLVVYHSSLEPLDQFKRAGLFMGHTGTSGISVTDSPEMASRYLDRYGSFRYDGKPFEKNLIPLYVKADNPLYRQEPFPTTLRLGAPLLEGYVSPVVRMGHDALIRNDSISRGGPVKHSAAKNAIRGREIIVFNPKQIKSATGNSGAFSPADPDIRFNIATDWQQSPVAQEVAKAFSAAARSDAALSWLNPVQTQYHKAERLAKQDKFGFKRVFDLGQRFLSDISRFAVMAENSAPTLFHQIRSIADAKQAAGAALRGDFGKQRNADIRAIAAPLYEGTLYGGGNPMSGMVWSDAQLRSRFGLTDRQIVLYHEAREAVKVSMDEMAKSLIARHAKREKVAADTSGSLQDVAEVVRDTLTLRADVLADEAQAEHDDTMQQVKDLREAGRQDKRAADMQKEAEAKLESQQAEVARIRATVADVQAIADKAQKLQDAGYFPLMRFGRHTVTARDADGKVQHFSMHDGIPLVPRSGQAQASRLADALREEHPDWDVTTGLMNPEKYKLYQGMNVDALQLFADHLDDETKKTYQDIIRLATNERSALRRMLKREGTPGFDRDVRRTLASFIMSNARYTSSAYHLADMVRAAEQAEEDGGDIGAEAVKLYEYVAKPQEEAAKIRGFLFFNFLGGSLAAAIVNATQVPMMTFPRLSQYEQPGKLAARLVRAAKLAVRNPADIHGDIGAALRRAEEDGITAPHQIYEMTATAANNVFTGSRAGSALLRAWGAPFALAESFNRRTTFIAAYQIGRQMTESQLRDAGAASAFEFAEKIVQETQGIYNRGNRVNVGRGAIGATVMSFKQFSVMYLEMLGRLPPKQQAIMAGMLILAAGAGGLPFAEDIEDIIDTIGQWLGYRTNTRRTIRRSLSSVAGQRAADIAMNGVLSQLGVDLHSRLGLHNILPGSALLKPSTTDKSREFQDLLGPAASVVAAMGQALQDLATGRPDKAAMAMAPVAVQNLVKGAKMAATGSAEDMRGKPTIQVSQAEAVAKGIGFNPKSVADYGTAKRDIMQDERLIDVTRERFTSAIVDAIITGDQKARRDALQQVSEWNMRNPDARISINPDVIRRRVVSMRSEGPERVLKSLSPSLRHQARQEFSSVQ